MVTNVVNSAYTGFIKTPARKLDRKILTPVKDEFVSLSGPKEKSKALKWVAAFTAGNAGIAFSMAQTPGADELALSAVEATMAAHIFNNIYNFDLSKTAMTSIVTGYIGNKVGTTAFKGASKFLTWIPLVGNSLNAVIAGTTTAALGVFLVDKAEDMDLARKTQKRLTEALDEIGK